MNTRSHIYGEDENPVLPYVTTGIIVARNITISGFDPSEESMRKKGALLKSGAKRTQILMFDIPKGFNSSENLNFCQQPPSITIKTPCIIGYIVEPFPAFPLVTSPG